VNLAAIQRLSDAALTDAERERVAEIVGANVAAISARLDALAPAQRKFVRGDLADWELIDAGTMKLTGKVDLDPERDRAQIRARLKARLGLPADPEAGTGAGYSGFYWPPSGAAITRSA
jgi:hypothetical protein